MDAADLCHLPATEQKRLLDRRELSCAELLEAQIARIERHNPALNAFVTLRLEQAQEDAEARDSERARGDAKGVLHGLTVGVKDCFATRGLRTTYASPAFADHVPDRDHLVVEREKAAGAIVLGKLNTPEFTMATNTCSNSVFGATRNPWNTALTPGASSGGSGAALAAGLASLADGSDIGGSVRNPAAWCNVVGHRPTAWTIPDVPNPLYWHNMNSPGPMARTVADAALFLSALAGPDLRCPVFVQAPFPPGLPDLAIDMAKIRIGWPGDRGAFAIERSLRANFDAQRDVFEGLGAAVEACDFDLSGTALHGHVLAHQRLAREVEPALGRGLDAGLAREYERTMAAAGADFMAAEAHRHRLWRDMAAAFERHDVLVWPDDPRDPYGFDDEAAGDAVDWTLLYVSPMLGLPTTTVPCGFSEAGAPRGLQIVGRPGDDLRVLRVARAYEEATGFGARRPPLDG